MLIRTGFTAEAARSASSTPATVQVTTPAKVNLFLEILGKRPDHYHELQTLLLAVNLCDELELAPNDTGAIQLTSDEPALATGPDNLICKAAALLRARTGCSFGATIRLTKRIPWAAGLGGGSSDAAATLAGLNVLWNLNLDSTALVTLGAELGSDIPFFLNGSAAWCMGRGEIMTPLPVPRSWDLVLVKPPEGLATADVYRRVTIPTTPVDGTAIRQAFLAGDTHALGRALHNRLQEAAFALSPAVASLFARLQQLGAAGCLMSGSGSCLFALVHQPSEAQQIADDLLRGSAAEVPPGTRTFIVQSCLDIQPAA